MSVIAVVEDNADNRLLLQALLGDLYELREYADGPTAVAGILSEQPLPDLLLLDISLEGMDGVEVLARLRADARLRDVPAIALTANVMLGDRERFLGVGFDEYVTKPIVDERLLLDAIARLLGRGRG